MKKHEWVIKTCNIHIFPITTCPALHPDHPETKLASDTGGQFRVTSWFKVHVCGQRSRKEPKRCKEKRQQLAGVKPRTFCLKSQTCIIQIFKTLAVNLINCAQSWPNTPTARANPPPLHRGIADLQKIRSTVKLPLCIWLVLVLLAVCCCPADGNQSQIFISPSVSNMHCMLTAGHKVTLGDCGWDPRVTQGGHVNCMLGAHNLLNVKQQLNEVQSVIMFLMIMIHRLNNIK